VQTAVQNESLPSLNRVRRARRILNRLRPLIASAQGELAPKEIAARFQETRLPESGASGSTPGNPSYIVDDPNAPPRIIS
jgi:hypothetical protein